MYKNNRKYLPAIRLEKGINEHGVVEEVINKPKRTHNLITMAMVIDECDYNTIFGHKNTHPDIHMQGYDEEEQTEEEMKNQVELHHSRHGCIKGVCIEIFEQWHHSTNNQPARNLLKIYGHLRISSSE